MEWYHVWWPWPTSKCVVRVCQHQLSFLLLVLDVFVTGTLHHFSVLLNCWHIDLVFSPFVVNIAYNKRLKLLTGVCNGGNSFVTSCIKLLEWSRFIDLCNNLNFALVICFVKYFGIQIVCSVLCFTLLSLWRINMYVNLLYFFGSIGVWEPA